MDKDFDYEVFQQFMRSISGLEEAIKLEQQKRSTDIVQTLDALDHVNDMTECLEAIEMLESIGVKI